MAAKRLLLMAGGTGGHIIPGLAVARHLLMLGWEVRWLGCIDRLEAEWVPQAGIPIEFIKISGLCGRKIGTQLTAPWQIGRAVYQAALVIKHFRPDVVLGFGGYVAGPGGLASCLWRVPLVIHEQNAVLGLTNRLLSYGANQILTAFPGTHRRAQVVGNPLPETLLQLPKPLVRFTGRQGPLRLLVLGGSQGAQILNHLLPAVAAQLGTQIIIWHQVGRGRQTTVAEAYRAVGITPYRLSEFIEDMQEAYRWADLVIGRSGAATVSELAAIGLSAIFIPYQHADQQQLLNAQVLQRVGAAEIIEEPQFTAERLAERVQRLDRSQLLQQAQQAQTVACRGATQQIADCLQAVVESSNKGNRACSHRT